MTEPAPNTSLPDYLRGKWQEALAVGGLQRHKSQSPVALQYHAMLALLDIHTQERASTGPYCGACTPRQYRWPCATLRTLALPYVDEPDFNTEWWSL